MTSATSAHKDCATMHTALQGVTLLVIQKSLSTEYSGGRQIITECDFKGISQFCDNEKWQNHTIKVDNCTTEVDNEDY